MPWGDGSGPLGLGPMTGRAAGFCAGYPLPGYMNRIGGQAAWPRGVYAPQFRSYGYPGVPWSYPAYRVGWGRPFGRGFGFGLGPGRGFGRGRWR